MREGRLVTALRIDRRFGTRNVYKKHALVTTLRGVPALLNYINATTFQDLVLPNVVGHDMLGVKAKYLALGDISTSETMMNAVMNNLHIMFLFPRNNMDIFAEPDHNHVLYFVQCFLHVRLKTLFANIH